MCCFITYLSYKIDIELIVLLYYLCLLVFVQFLSLTLSLLSLISILNAASHGKNGEVSSAQYVGEGIKAATFVSIT